MPSKNIDHYSAVWGIIYFVRVVEILGVKYVRVKDF